MGELCAAVGASDRTLRACCHEHLGMSPTRYLWLRRMNLARRALRVADRATTTVTEIATNYGFWELGRFSVAYRCYLGNRPRRRCAGQPKTPYRKKASVRLGSFRNLHSRRRTPEPILGPAHFRSPSWPSDRGFDPAGTQEEECREAAQALSSIRMTIERALAICGSISLLPL